MNSLSVIARLVCSRVSLQLARGCSIGVMVVAVSWLLSDRLPAFEDPLAEQFQSQLKPLLERYCSSCHSGSDPEAKLDTTIFTDPAKVALTWDMWQNMVARCQAGEMPPADAGEQPTPAVRAALRDWTDRFGRAEARRMQGDPGPISVRRLSNAEFNYTIRDLTGIDIRPTRNFPVDPANEAGFDNSAESLTISPALIGKYLDAAREVASHMLLTPDGIRFAPFPVVTDTDRDKYCVQRIVDFYRRHEVRIEDYLLASWRVRMQATAQGPQQMFDQWIDAEAAAASLSPRYLRTVWSAVNDNRRTLGPLAELKQRWQSLPLDPSEVDNVRRACVEIAASLVELRQQISPQFPNLKGPGLSGGSQTLVLWKNRKMATHRRALNREALNKEASILDAQAEAAWENAPPAERMSILETYEDFCACFPDTFFVLERGRAHIDPKEAAKEAKGRLLSAGFHSMTGFFRDDQPLCELVLSEQEKHELDQLWLELDFIALAPFRQYSGFIWYERAESGFINEATFNFVRAEDRSATTTAMIERFAELYIDKVRRREGSAEMLEAAEYYFADMDRQLRKLERMIAEAQPKQLNALIAFAEQAFRQPISDEIRQRIEAFYKSALTHPNADHRSAMEDTLVSILLSPAYLYRWDLRHPRATVQTNVEPEPTATTKPQATPQLQPIGNLELASRLSFFVWSSLPDEELLARASNGKLEEEDSLQSELTRMLKDPKASAMVREFLGNWLDFRRFDAHQGVDREQFPEFDDALRQSMADEPIEYFGELLRRNGSVLELLDSNHMMVDGRLALFYGLNSAGEAHDEPAIRSVDTLWQRVDQVRDKQRGGLISMAVFLTQNSPGQRTSPVKRGYWIVRRLLGEHIPAPPPNVPELPSSEHQLGDLTLRELLAKHREHASCAACHDRFDSIGLLLEGFNPIGLTRTEDLSGHALSLEAILPNGARAEGFAGLKEYILAHRVEDFRRQFCRSLLAYALGRSLILPDELLVDEMLAQLERNDNRIQTAFEVIVRSSQFRNRRSFDFE